MFGQTISTVSTKALDQTNKTTMSTISFANKTKLSQYFNDKTISDCKLLFTKSETILFLHKFILMIESDFFKACFEHDTIESREGIVKIDQEDDEKLLTDLIKSLYTCHLEINDKKQVVPLILLAQKYKLNALIPVLIDHLISTMDCSNAVQCLHLDLEQDQFKTVKRAMKQRFEMSSDEILKGKTYFTLSVEQWMSVLEMLVHKYNDKSAFYAINSWIAEDVENRAQYCFALNSQIGKAVQHNSPPMLFDPQFIGKSATLSRNNKRIAKNGESGFNCGALGTKCASFSVRLIKNCGKMMIGMAPRAINKDGQNYNRCGWYLSSKTGRLHSQTQSGDDGQYFLSPGFYRPGAVVGVSLENGEMSFSVDGQASRVAFRGLNDFDLYPAFDLGGSVCEFEFV